MTAQERWLIAVVAFLVLFGSAARRLRPSPTPDEAPAAEAPSVPDRAAEAADDREDDGGLVDLNRCEAGGLERLPGLGPVKARRVIEWRESHGPFRSVEDLTKVRGIGPKTLRRLRSRLTVSAGAREDGETPGGADAGEKREDHER